MTGCLQSRWAWCLPGRDYSFVSLYGLFAKASTVAEHHPCKQSVVSPMQIDLGCVVINAGYPAVPLFFVWCLCSLGPLPPLCPLVHIPSHKPVLVFANMFLTLTFQAESIGSAAKFFRRRRDHGELAMAAVLNRKNTGYFRRRMPKTRTGKATRYVMSARGMDAG